MNYKIKTLPDFNKELKRLSKKYKSIRKDYAKLLNELHANPNAGVDLGEGMRKVRMAIASKNRGKSHGARVIDYVYKINEVTGKILLLFIYDKAEMESIPPHRIAELLAIARANLGINDDEDFDTL